MPPSKTPLTKEQQKQAKQKKLLLFLIPVLAVLAIVQGPKLMKAVGGGSAAETSAAATTGTADTGAAVTDPASTAPAATDPAGTTVAPVAVPAGPVELVDSDLPPLADEGQLIVFDRFVGKDPFKQLVVPPDDSQQPDVEPDAEPGDGEEETLPDTAVLLVNDGLESVALGAAFPAAEPTFRLVALDAAAKLVRIGLVSGSFSTGSPTVEVAVGETLTLVSQPDGVRFEIKLKKLTTSSGE
jgi:hypothetical protein